MAYYSLFKNQLGHSPHWIYIALKYLQRTGICYSSFNRTIHEDRRSHTELEYLKEEGWGVVTHGPFAKPTLTPLHISIERGRILSHDKPLGLRLQKFVANQVHSFLLDLAVPTLSF